jgi:hypothetical protein
MAIKKEILDELLKDRDPKKIFPDAGESLFDHLPSSWVSSR